jgi:hypothetical protein
LDPIEIAQLAALGINVFSRIYDAIQKANADKVKPLTDILSAANNIDDAGIATAKAEIAKLIHP